MKDSAIAEREGTFIKRRETIKVMDKILEGKTYPQLIDGVFRFPKAMMV